MATCSRAKFSSDTVKRVEWQDEQEMNCQVDDKWPQHLVGADTGGEGRMVGADQGNVSYGDPGGDSRQGAPCVRQRALSSRMSAFTSIRSDLTSRTSALTPRTSDLTPPIAACISATCTEIDASPGPLWFTALFASRACPSARRAWNNAPTAATVLGTEAIRAAATVGSTALTASVPGVGRAPFALKAGGTEPVVLGVAERLRVRGAGLAHGTPLGAVDVMPVAGATEGDGTVMGRSDDEHV